MFLDPIRGRSRGYVLAAAAVFATGACNDPEQNTDLRPAGPPEVLAVLVATDASAFLYESATYCAPNDEKRPTRVGLPDFTLQQICDDDVSAPASMVTDAYPDGWYIRIMFDELLDPNIEELTEILDPDTGMGTDTFSGSIAGTQPVKLECESIGGGFVEVAYDGYYNPAGNAITWPLGPSLVIKPNNPLEVATGKMCRITINENVVDKSGEAVRSEQRGPYPFKIAPIQILATDPADGDDVDAFTIFNDGVYVTFNTYVDPASFCDEGTAMNECEFEFLPDAGGADFYDDSDVEFGFFTNGAPMVGTDYVFQFKQGTSIKDRCGVATTFGAPSAADQTKIEFATNPFDLNSTSINNGDTAAPVKKMALRFSSVVDDTSLLATEYSITPTVPGLTVVTNTGGELTFAGHFQPGTAYTFTLNAGATVLDANGAVYTNAAAETIMWTTQPAITVATSPADMSTLTKATATSVVGINLSFNQSMDDTTLTAADYTLTDSGGAAVAGVATAVLAGCLPESSNCVLQVGGNLAPGDYKFTLNAGAAVTDVLGNVFTQAAAKVINFTVEIADPASPIQCL